MNRTKSSQELNHLRNRLRLLESLLGALFVLLVGALVLTLVMSLVLSFPPLLVLSVLGAGGALLVWVTRARLLGAARRRFNDADWLLTSVQPRAATLYFNQALVSDGVVCALFDDQPLPRARAAVIQFSKLNYPRREMTPITLFEDDTCPTLLIRLNGRYFDGIRLDREAFEGQRRRFERTMNGVLIGTGLVCGSVALWALALDQDPALALSMVGAWLMLVALIRYLVMRLNRDRLQQIVSKMGWSSGTPL